MTLAAAAGAIAAKISSSGHSGIWPGSADQIGHRGIGQHALEHIEQGNRPSSIWLESPGRAPNVRFQFSSYACISGCYSILTDHS